MREQIVAAGLTDELAVLGDAPTGLTVALESAQRDRTFLTYLGVNAGWGPELIPPDALRCDNLLLCDFVAPALQGDAARGCSNRAGRRRAHVLRHRVGPRRVRRRGPARRSARCWGQSTCSCPTRPRRARGGNGCDPDNGTRMPPAPSRPTPTAGWSSSWAPAAASRPDPTGPS